MSGIFENARQILQNLHILRQRGYEQINMVRPLLNMVARARGYNFEPGTQFAIDLTKEPPTAYFDMNFYVKEQGYTPEQSEFALLHEIRCHLVEKDKLQESDEGKAAYEERRVREEQVDWLHIWENCRTDAAGNWSILLEISPALQEAAESLYKDKLFASRDFRKMPRHLQFCYAVLVEKMLPSATDVQVVPEVREAIDRLKNTSFVAPDGQVYQDALEYVTRPDRLWDSGDLALWRYQMSKEYVEPEIEKLYEEDLKNPDPDWQKQKGKGKGRRKGSAGKSPFAGEYQDYNSRIHPQTWSEDDEQKLPESTRPQNEEGAEEQDNTDEDDSENDASSSPQPPKMDQSQREQFKSKHGLTEGEMQVMESYDQVYREVSPY